MSSIRKVARTCQVSPMTVSLVLNNPDTGRVSPETRARVLKVVRDLGYRPKPRASEPAAVKTIGVVEGIEAGMFSGDHYSGRVLQGILQQPGARLNNYMMFSPHVFQEGDIHNAVRAYCDGKCDALIDIAPSKHSALVRALILRGLPLVVIGTSEPFEDLEGACAPVVIDLDNRAVGRQAAAHLAALGHRRIAFIGGVEHVVSTLQRHMGYEEGMAQAGLPINPRWVRSEVLKGPRAREIVTDLMALPKEERPTAIFCWNDGVALEALRLLKERGIRVPEDISILGIDDSPHDIGSDPALTSFRQPFDEIGARTMASLQRLFELIPGEVMEPERHLLSAELIVRGSTAPPLSD